MGLKSPERLYLLNSCSTSPLYNASTASVPTEFCT